MQWFFHFDCYGQLLESKLPWPSCSLISLSLLRYDVKQQQPRAAGSEEDVILTGQGLGVGRATRQVPRLRAALAGRRLELVICTQEIAKGATWIAMVDLECSGKFLDTPFWVFFPVCLNNSWHIKLIKNAEDKKGKRLWINKENFCQKTGWGEIPKAYI